MVLEQRPASRPASVAADAFIEEALRRSSLFAELTPPEFATLLGIMRRRRRPKGDLILSQHDAGSVAFLIVRGEANVVLEREDGRTFLLRRMGPGDFFGELSLLDAEPRSASVVAATDVDMLVLPREPLIEELLRRPRLMLRMLESLSRRLRATTAQLATMAFDDAAERLMELMLDNAVPGPGGLQVRATQDDLAQMIGTSRQTVARIFSAWRRRGLIATSRERTVVTDAAGLRAAVQSESAERR